MVIAVTKVFSKKCCQTRIKSLTITDKRRLKMGPIKYVSHTFSPGDFKLVFQGTVADILTDNQDYTGVIRATKDLQTDINTVSGLQPAIKQSSEGLSDYTVIVGTVGKSELLGKLVAEGKIDLSELQGKWESFTIQVVDSPLPGVNAALVIAGSDQRGTIFGLYDLSEQIGVSPWHWWADVTPDNKDSLIIKKGIYHQGEPSVKYRGIFLNNEWPSLTNWVEKRYGSFNHHFYERVFELILRLKANYLWPAMWSPKSFNRDDPLNAKKAHEYGIVMGTSHHEPLARSWGEWSRFGEGDWSYLTNQANLDQYWSDGVELVKDYENVFTIGMRGDGDEPMLASATIEEKVALMEKIIANQRKLLAKWVNPDVTQVPQMMALYKEVQEYYENGLAVPEDVTILMANDNFGNIRMLPKEEERDRAGGYGMYYHFDYVGGPRSYRWVNGMPIPKMWHQMYMAYEHGVDRIWLVNAGCLKPHEVTTEFFLQMAWDINRWNKDNLAEFAKEWATREFGETYAGEIADIVMKYKKYNGRRKPEIVEPTTYSLQHYREAEQVLADFEAISIQAEEIYQALPSHKRNAFYQLVLYPTRASKNVLKINVYTGLNHLYAKHGSAMANTYADVVEGTFKKETRETRYYNKILNDAKWDGIMSDAHIGQKGWRGPVKNELPKLNRLELQSGSEMGIFVEGGDDLNLPQFSVFTKDKYYIDIFNKKQDSFRAKISASEPWIHLSLTETPVEKQIRLWVEIDWDNLPQVEQAKGTITISGAGQELTVQVDVFQPEQPLLSSLPSMTFIESNGYISIEAEHYGENKQVNKAGWNVVPDYGRTLSSMVMVPSTVPPANPPVDAPYLEYNVYVFNPGQVNVYVYTAPSLNTNRERGLSYGISFNDQKPQIVDTFPREFDAHHFFPWWNIGVKDNIRQTNTIHELEEAGWHRLRFFMVDPGVVLQKIVIDTGGLKRSYLGPPESFFTR